MISEKDIGNRVRILREIKGEAQITMGAKAFTQPSRWHDVESNRTPLKWSDVVAVCDALDFSPSNLVGESRAFFSAVAEWMVNHLEDKN